MSAEEEYLDGEFYQQEIEEICAVYSEQVDRERVDAHYSSKSSY